MNNSYKIKYLKYKNKYIQLKNQIYGGVIDSNPNKDKLPFNKSDLLQYTSDETEWKKRLDAFSDYVKQGSFEAEASTSASTEANKIKALRRNQTLYAAVVDFNQNNCNFMTIISVHKTEAEAQEKADKQAAIDKDWDEPCDVNDQYDVYGMVYPIAQLPKKISGKISGKIYATLYNDKVWFHGSEVTVQYLTKSGNSHRIWPIHNSKEITFQELFSNIDLD
jgi:hypothetical protein